MKLLKAGVKDKDLIDYMQILRNKQKKTKSNFLADVLDAAKDLPSDLKNG
jgi:hypothetical protein